jgi:hypothetical protein
MLTELDSTKWYCWLFGALAHSDVLQIILIEGIISEHEEDITVCGKTISGGHPIEPNSTSRRATITFKDILAYSVLNESYSCNDDSAVGTVGVISKRSASSYLSYLLESSCIKDFYDQPISHYRIATSDYIINVIASSDPIIKLSTDNHKAP